MYFCSPIISATCPIQLILLDLISWIIYGEKYELWSPPCAVLERKTPFLSLFRNCDSVLSVQGY
jgi:hypothetical protein